MDWAGGTKTVCGLIRHVRTARAGGEIRCSSDRCDGTSSLMRRHGTAGCRRWRLQLTRLVTRGAGFVAADHESVMWISPGW
jgi:hypothetical protein